jgi:hypothetical protein
MRTLFQGLDIGWYGGQVSLLTPSLARIHNTDVLTF